MQLMEPLNTRFGLRKYLRQNELSTSTSSISESALDISNEPTIRTYIKELAIKISKNPDVLFADESTLVERKASWYSLVNKQVDMNTPLDSRCRSGHILLDYHMPHFWSVRGWKGVSIVDLASDSTILYKALWANLRMHSTPYISEIRRSLCMVGGLSNVTKYRAPLAKAIVEGFEAKSVLDPCAGWGGRMIGSLAAGATYVGYEPCLKTVEGLNGILQDLPQEIHSRARIISTPAEEGILDLDEFDMVLTSPPYYNLENYSTEYTQSITGLSWEEWLDGWLDPVIQMCLSKLKEGGTSCWSVKNFRTDAEYRLADEVKASHERAGWRLVNTVKMIGSSRPGEGRIQRGAEARNSEEETFCFQRA